MRLLLHSLGVAAVITVGAACGAIGGERHGYDGYGGYGFASEAIGGDYIGAPLTRFPRPSELVPAAWGYGTYGVPTVAGIRQAPTAAPTLTVIESYGPVPRRSRRTLSRNAEVRSGADERMAPAGLGGVRVIAVTVPRR